MDKLKHIRELLRKFYEGETSVAEEQELEAFFNNEKKVPEEFTADREFFRSLAILHQPVEVPGDLHSKIISNLSSEERREHRVRRINIYSFSALAAGLLIILSVYLGIIREGQQNSITQYAIEDPEQAYIEARRALEYVSHKWNSGTSELENLNQVQKTINKVSTINKLSSGSKELILLGNLEKADNIEL
ncbi:MAG: hypothetical protein WD578_00435 [Bacteroidales bacterium]